MKKLMTFLAFAVVASSMTTGCTHKKRIKVLKEEITRCRNERTALLSEADTQPPADTTFAVVTQD